LPHASYQISPCFWLDASLKRGADVDPMLLPALKRREPQITGLAYGERAIWLVVVAGTATYEHIARLMHCRALMREDPDHAEHRDKRVSMVMLCDDCSPAVLDFARRHRVNVITQAGQIPAGIRTRTDTSFDASPATDPNVVLKPFSP
jgi:hypothetical protein